MGNDLILSVEAIILSLNSISVEVDLLFLTIQGYLVPDSINKELTKKPQKFYSKSTVIFNGELSVIPSGAPSTREEVRKSAGKMNIQNDTTGVGYQSIGNNNTIG